MYHYEFTDTALKQLKKLPKQAQSLILRKLDTCCASPNPFFYTKRIIDSALGEYRIRQGDYRIVCDIEDELIIILKVGHRKEIYK